MNNYQMNESFGKTEKVLSALKMMIDKPMQVDRSNIDAAMHRFEFSIDLFLSLLKRILAARGVEAVYPKDVLQQAYAGKLINDEQEWLAMVRDRNITSHAYNEQLADEIFKNIKNYFPVLESTFIALKKQYYKEGN